MSKYANKERLSSAFEQIVFFSAKIPYFSKGIFNQLIQLVMESSIER